MTKRYLVTGGNGFIGEAIVRALVSAEYEVIVFDNNSRGYLNRFSDISNRLTFIKGDIRDEEQLNAAAHGATCLIHLAYINGTKTFYEHPELVLDVAIKGIINVIEVCKRRNIREIFLASSSEVYQTPKIIPTPESVELVVPDVLNPRYSYGGGKLLCELVIANYGRTLFDRAIIFRPHNIYGPNMGYGHVIPELTKRAINFISTMNDKNPGRFTLLGDGTQTRSFCYIEDFTRGFMTLLRHGKHLEIYNIGTTDEVSIKTVANKIFEILGAQSVLYASTTGPKGETLRRCPDISKITNLGYTPIVNFDAGLQATVGWYKTAINQKAD